MKTLNAHIYIYIYIETKTSTHEGVAQTTPENDNKTKHEQMITNKIIIKQIKETPHTTQ
jgi:hypothetical protein